MPKIHEQKRVRAHRWRDSIFVQLVIKYPFASRFILILLIGLISYQIWKIGFYIFSQNKRVQLIESFRSEEPKIYNQAKFISSELELYSKAKFKQKDNKELSLHETLQLHYLSVHNSAKDLLFSYEQMSRRDILSTHRIKDHDWLCLCLVRWNLLVEDYDEALYWIDYTVHWHEKNEIGFHFDELEILNKLRKESMGLASIHIDVPESIREVILWPLIKDKSRILQSDPILRTNKYPIKRNNLKPGSYLIWASLPNGRYQVYPINLDRLSKFEYELELPLKHNDNWRFIPAGGFTSGGDPSIYRLYQDSLPSYYISKNEVTLREYIEFWLSIKDDQLKTKYAAYFFDSKKEKKTIWNKKGELIFSGLTLEHPVCGITSDAAEAFCIWKSDQTDSVIRLPNEKEWEKAARGVDGRKYCWGNGLDGLSSLFNVKNSDIAESKKEYLEPVGSNLQDISVFLVHEMVGNIREIIKYSYTSNFVYGIKGSSYLKSLESSACTITDNYEIPQNDIGFRVVMEQL